jgi:hypothetical protein
MPQDLDGIGVYSLHAAVPSPYLNVICANVAGEEMTDLVYANWTGVTLNSTLDFSDKSTHWFANANWTAFNTLESTPLDETFGWTKPTDRPAFYKFPIDFNTVLNSTELAWGQKDSIYLLGKGAPEMANYTMCKIKAGLTPYCSTQFTATGSGGSLMANCEDPKDEMQYIRGNSSRQTTTSLDWFNVASEALQSLSLNTGVTDGAAANSRLLMQLALTEPNLNAALPSPAEALSVMAGCTLLMSADDSPFVEFWNYTATTLSPGQYQAFNASIRAQQFASGGTQSYQRGFYIILFGLFLLNVFVLIYLLINKGLVTDFSEPPNLFSLAVNSPPSHLLAGSCGGGPHGKQYQVNWGIETEGQHLFMTDKKSDYGGDYSRVNRNIPEEIELEGGMQRPLTPHTPHSPHSPNIQRSKSKFGRAYSMLSKRKSMF